MVFKVRFHRIFQCFRSDSDDNLQLQLPVVGIDGGQSRAPSLFHRNVERMPEKERGRDFLKQAGRSGQNFDGNDEYFIENGKILLEERVSLFDGRTNPIRCFSVDDLNSMNVNSFRFCEEHNFYSGVWDGNLVMVKHYCHDVYGSANHENRKQACREIAVATQMGTHSNVHRLLGFSLVFNIPVLVYAWADNGTLEERIFKYKEQSKQALKWKDRLRIAWEIAYAVAYLHTAFRRPIIHRDLKPSNVFLDHSDSARLSDFSLAISIPEGKKHVEDAVKGTFGYAAPEYIASERLAESADVYSFGALFLVLLTGKPAYVTLQNGNRYLTSWVSDCHAANNLSDIVDPAITSGESVTYEHFEKHLQELVELALRCLSDEGENRPTMVEVATKLKNMITLTPHSLKLQNYLQYV